MRPTASIIIPAWNEWELTRSCLESLRPTLGLRDQVIVVDNGSVDGTSQGLARYSWVTVVSHPQNLGFAAGCNSGAAVATGDVVIFLNNDTLVPSRWLDGLLAPLTDPTVGATGPRSNFVSGPQLVEQVTYDPHRMSDLQRYARDWRQAHRGQTTEVTRLVGFCLAVRRGLFEELNGFDEQFGLGGAEDDDLCLRLVDAGHRLLITHEAFVHHHGHRTFVANDVDWFALQQDNLQLLAGKRGAEQRAVDSAAPLLSACMIVKNEEANLPGCLAALHGLVDEIVVYDTGSADDTVDIARAAGAIVVQGYWDDDFARARNSALEHCTGDWILQVDADELVQGDSAAIRAELAAAPADALETRIDNLGDDGRISVSHAAVRLFRRGRARWSGGLHERVVASGPVLLDFGHCATLRLHHSGYTSAADSAGDKAARNLRVARAAVEADGGTDLHVKVSLARALISAGQAEEAMTHLEDVRAKAKQTDVLRHALRTGAEALIALSRPEEALTWARELRRYSSSSMPAYLEGIALAQAGQTDQALVAFKGLSEVTDEEFSLAPHMAGVHRARMLVDAGLWARAAEELWQLASQGILPTASWPALVETHWRANLGFERLADVLGGDQVVPVLGKLLGAPVEPFDLFLECLWDRWGNDARLLAAAAQLGPRLGIERAMDWSLRLRANGLVQECTLASLASSASAPALDRLRACAVLHQAVDDPRGSAALGQAAAAVPIEDLHTALLALDELSPRLLGRFVDHAASDATRSRALAEVLTSLGATEQAETVLAHYVA